MAIHWKRSKGIALGGVLAALALSGCGGEGCPDWSDLDRAADYKKAHDREGRSFRLDPLNAWVERPDLTAFLRKSAMTGGAEALVSKYQFRCEPNAAGANCADCYTCTRAIPKYYTSFTGLSGRCTSYGEILVQAYVGPGANVRAMTYWRIREGLISN
jgi:hypothetical protein